MTFTKEELIKLWNYSTVARETENFVDEDLYNKLNNLIDQYDEGGC